MTPIDEIAVVIPANNEESLIGGCLESVVRAAETLRSELGPRSPRVSITVVADACDDNTVKVARGIPGVAVVEIAARTVGTARASGVNSVLERHVGEKPQSIAYRSVRRGHSLDRVWIANTDADSEVPAEWMLLQWYLARGGVDVVVGTVQPNFDDLSPTQVEAWRETHDDGQALGHVHGANLGVRASAYLAAGGFRDDAEHEDVALVERLRTAGSVIIATDDARVVTSGRRVGRTPGGYAGYLRETLVAEAAAGDPALQPYRLVRY